MTREADETLPEELREAIESERLWDALPPELEERLARRIGGSLAAMEAVGSQETGAPPAGHGAPPAGTSQGVRLADIPRASASLKWVAVLAGGLLVGGAVGAGIATALRPPAPGMNLPVRNAPEPASTVAPEAPRPLPLAPAAQNEVPPSTPRAKPSPGSKPPSKVKPSAPSRAEPRQVPPPPSVEAAPAEETSKPSESDAFGREWSLLEMARTANALGRYDDSLAAVTRHAQEYPSSQFEQEREALRIHALVGLGRKEEARALARGFEQHFPESLLLESIRQAAGNE